MSKLSERRLEIREYTTEQAEQELQRLRRQLFDLRIQQQRGEVKNNRQFNQVRTDIARLLYQLDLLALAEAEEALAAEEALEEEVVEEEEEEAAEEEEAVEEEAEEAADEAIEAAEAEEEEEAASASEESGTKPTAEEEA